VKAKGVLYGLWEPHASQFEHSEEQGKEVGKFDARLKTTGPLHMATARLALNYNTPPSNTPLKEWVSAVDSESVGLEPLLRSRNVNRAQFALVKPPRSWGIEKTSKDS